MNKKIKDDILLIFFFFFKQKTAYEITASDWSSDVCSSDLQLIRQRAFRLPQDAGDFHGLPGEKVVRQNSRSADRYAAEGGLPVLVLKLERGKVKLCQRAPGRVGFMLVNALKRCFGQCAPERD